MNITALVGRLTKDPELRYTQSGTAVCEFTLAVTRDFKNAQGDYDSDFIRCIVWRKSAENLLTTFTRVHGRKSPGALKREAMRTRTGTRFTHDKGGC